MDRNGELDREGYAQITWCYLNCASAVLVATDKGPWLRHTYPPDRRLTTGFDARHFLLFRTRLRHFQRRISTFNVVVWLLTAPSGAPVFHFGEQRAWHRKTRETDYLN